MKKCPFCQEDIHDAAIKCRYCGEWLDKKEESAFNKDVFDGRILTPTGLSSKQSTVATAPMEKNKRKPRIIFSSWKTSILALVIAAFGLAFIAPAGTKIMPMDVFWTWWWLQLTFDGWKYLKWKTLLPFPIVILTLSIILIITGGQPQLPNYWYIGSSIIINIGGLILFYWYLKKSQKEIDGETTTLNIIKPEKKDSIDWQIKLQNIWDDYWAYFIVVPIIILVAGIIFTLAQKPNLNKGAEQGTESESAKLIDPWANPDGTLNAEGRKQMDRLNRDFRNTGEAQLSKANKAIHLNPNDADAYLKRGSAYTILHQPQRAIEDYNEAIRLKPDAETYSSRGFFYSIIGQYKLAIEDYNEVIRLKPDSADGYGGRGFVYGQLGNNELRCRDLKKACTLGECKQLETSKENGFCR